MGLHTARLAANKEEAATLGLEALRLGAIQNELGLPKNIDAGMEYAEFGPEMRAPSDRAVMESVAPKGGARVGGPATLFVSVFNRAIAPAVGRRIEAVGRSTSANQPRQTDIAPSGRCIR